MSRIFMSHSSRDSRQALALKKWLAEQEPPLANEIFLDIDARTGLQPGDRWKEALQRANARCEAVICLLSGNWSNSAECRVEYRLAENLNKQVLCARLEQSPADELTAEWQRCDLFGDGEVTSVELDDGPPVAFATDGLYRLRDAVRGAGIGARSFAWPPPGDEDRAPYRGWEPFERQDAGVFFGRDSAIVRALDDLRGMRQSGVKSMFVVLGPSGAGKSSFLRAGILPRLAREDRRFTVLGVVRPDRNVLTGDTGLAAAIWQSRLALGLTESSLGDIKSAITGDPDRVVELLADIQRGAASRIPVDDGNPAPPTLILPVDQAEELFSADAGSQAAQFISLMSNVARRGLGLVVISTIRTDRYEVMQTHPELADLQTQLFDDLKPMPAGQFKEVITGPAERATQAGHPLQIAPDLVDRLLAETSGGADTLPLLSLTMAELYTDYGSSGTLTSAQYDAMGGLNHVVQNAIDSVLSPEPDRRSEQLQALRAAFIPWLATINPDNDQPLRRVARLADLPVESRALIEALVDKRLMVKDIRDGETVVEVALESLLRQWKELAGWLRERRKDLLAADDLERSAAAWQAAGGDPAWLMNGTRLTDAEALVATAGFRERLASVHDFLTAARAQENEELRLDDERREADLRAAQERAEHASQRQTLAEAHGATLRRRSRFTAAVAVLAVIVAVAAAVGFVQASSAKRDAQQRYYEAASTRLVFEAKDILDSRAANLIRPLQMQLAAHALAPTPASRSALYASAVAYARLKMIIGQAGPVDVIAFSSDGSKLAIISRAGPARLWDPATGQPIGPALDTDTSPITAVAFSPDGSRIAVARYDGTLQLLDAGSSVPLGPSTSGHADWVTAVAFSLDGKRLATASEDGSVRLWNPGTGQPTGKPLAGQVGALTGMTFGPDGTKLATFGKENAAELWDLGSGQPVGKPLTGHTNSVTAVAFSPDRAIVATASLDGTARLWNPNTGQPLRAPLADPGNSGVTAIAFSPDGTTLATASLDGTARLWNPNTGQPLRPPLTEPGNSGLTAIAFSPDGTTLATAGLDGYAELWNPATGQPLGPPLTGHTSALNAIAFSPDGTTLATASLDGTAQLWDARPNEVLTGLNGPMSALAFSLDGSRLTAASLDGAIQRWNPTTGQTLGPLARVRAGELTAIAMSSDGTRLGTASDAGTAQLWDADTGQPVGQPLKAAGSPLTAIAVSPDGTTLATGSDDGITQLWNPTTGQLLGPPLEGRAGALSAIAFSADGTTLATANTNDASVQLWDAAAAKPLGPLLKGHEYFVDAIAFSPDGTTVATGSFDGSAQVWNAATGQPIGPLLKGQTGVLTGIAGVAFSPDGTTLATTRRDGTAQLWEAATGQSIGPPWKSQSNGLAGVAFSPDGTKLATATTDASVILLPAVGSPREVCAKLSTSMSDQQWRDWISPDIAYIEVCPGLPQSP